MMPSDDFAALIAGLEEQGIPQKEIARLSGVSRTTVWRIANGGCKDHLGQTFARVEQLARTFENIPPVKQKRA